MNKLIIAVAAVAMAACAQAAAVNWSAAAISSGNGVAWNGGKADTKGSGYAAYLFLTSSTATADAGNLVVRADILDALTAGDFSVLDKAIVPNGKSTAKTLTTSAGGVSSTAFGSYGVTQNDSITGFMVVFDNATPDDAGYFGISSEKTANVTQGATGSGSLSFTGYTATYGWTAISGGSPVPEPTSGLLMLLGVAGLALRRRRA